MIRVISGVAVRVASSIAVGVASGVAVGVVSGIDKVASSGARDIVSLFKVKLSWSYRATVIINLILIRVRPISLSIYL